MALRRAARWGARSLALGAAGGALYVAPFLPSPGVWPLALARAAPAPPPAPAQGAACGGAAPGSSGPSRARLVSVVVPVYNEGGAAVRRVVAQLRSRAARSADVEVVLVDAGCSDDSFAGAAPAGARVVAAPRGAGRGAALRRGAEAANGEILLFLHADTELPPHFDELVRAALREPDVLLGFFRFAVAAEGLAPGLQRGLRRLEAGTALRADYLWLPYGDQALAATREAYRELGGFRALSMMEDFDFVTRAREHALRSGRRLAAIPAPATCSARRWERHGLIGNTLRNWLFVAAYVWGGASPDAIFAWYYR
jgi:glycosyltransferase involved in cell wall biosynthesis